MAKEDHKIKSYPRRMVASDSFAEFLREQLEPLGPLSRRRLFIRNLIAGGETIDLSFWRAPDRLFDEPDELVDWARIALAAARRVAAKRGRIAPKRSPRRTDR